MIVVMRNKANATYHILHIEHLPQKIEFRLLQVASGGMGDVFQLSVCHRHL